MTGTRHGHKILVRPQASGNHWEDLRGSESQG